MAPVTPRELGSDQKRHGRPNWKKKLRAKGYDVSVAVNAVPGDGTAGYLSRADAAAAGARAVVFDAGSYNDGRTGVSSAVTEANIAQIEAHIRAHGAAAIHNRRDGAIPTLDGVHPTAEGHAMLAARAAKGHSRHRQAQIGWRRYVY